VPYGDAKAFEEAITENTVGFLVEPLQGEGGVVVPPEGYLACTARICRERGIAFMADEIQTGLGRTGRMFCCDWEDVRPDVLIVGKALGEASIPSPQPLQTTSSWTYSTPATMDPRSAGTPWELRWAGLH
jgi:ornithine--oxo-acid transaminase